MRDFTNKSFSELFTDRGNADSMSKLAPLRDVPDRDGGDSTNRRSTVSTGMFVSASFAERIGMRRLVEILNRKFYVSGDGRSRTYDTADMSRML